MMRASTTRSELLRKRLDRLNRFIKAVDQADPAALHQARVTSRRLRELIPVLKLGGGTARKLNRRLKKVTARLGTVRELDVMHQLVEELHASRPRGGGGLSRVGVEVSTARDEARKRLLAHLPTDALSRLFRKLERITGELEHAERASSKVSARSWRWAIDARVARRARHLTDTIEEAGAVYLPERLHAVRIAAKKLRYAVELATEAAGETGGADLRVLQRNQELLGRMHDIQVLIERVRDTQASLTPPNLNVWRDLDALMASLDDDCRRLHARYMRGRAALSGVAERRREQAQAPTTRAHARRAG
jgi:CHAD domain-containing protein